CGIRIPAADDTPWQGALETHDRCDLPALQKLSKTGLAGKRVSQSGREASPDVEVAAPVVGLVIERRSIGAGAFTGLLIESMTIREANRVRQTVCRSLRQRDLSGVVVGVHRIRHGVDVRIVRILIVERPRNLKCSRVDRRRRRNRRWTWSARTRS